MNETKHCSRCGEVKGIEFFHQHGRKISTWCGACKNKYRRDRRKGLVPAATCEWKGCDRAVEAGGYCGAHYKRHVRGSDMDAPMRALDRNARDELAEAALAYADAEFEEAPIRLEVLERAAASYVNWKRRQMAAKQRAA